MSSPAPVESCVQPGGLVEWSLNSSPLPQVAGATGFRLDRLDGEAQDWVT